MNLLAAAAERDGLPAFEDSKNSKVTQKASQRSPSVCCKLELRSPTNVRLTDRHLSLGAGSLHLLRGRPRGAATTGSDLQRRAEAEEQ